MFKNILLTTGLLAAMLSTSAFATTVPANTSPTVTGTVTVQSEYNDNGQSVSDDASVGLALRASDVLLEGVFVTAEVNSLNVTPLNDARTRSEIGFGYVTRLGSFHNVSLEGSVNRVFNPVLYRADYTELRARAGYSYFFVEAAHGLTNGVNRDTYVAIGAEAQFNPRWTGSVKVSAMNYDLSDTYIQTSCGSIEGCGPYIQRGHGSDNRYNNFEASTTYNVYGNFDVFATFSEGGRDALGSEISNQFWGGVQYRF